jgi:hypothetical protein
VRTPSFLTRTLTELDLDMPALRRMQRAFLHRVAEHGLADGPSTVTEEIVQRKLAQLELRATRVRLHRHTTAAELMTHSDALELVAYNLILVV